MFEVKLACELDAAGHPTKMWVTDGPKEFVMIVDNFEVHGGGCAGIIEEGWTD